VFIVLKLIILSLIVLRLIVCEFDFKLKNKIKPKFKCKFDQKFDRLDEMQVDEIAQAPQV